MPAPETTHESMRHYYRGRVFESTGELDIAIEEYRKAVDLGADYADIHNSLGRTYAKKGSFTEAKQEFEKALNINPHYLDAQRNLTELETRLFIKSRQEQEVTEGQKRITEKKEQPKITVARKVKRTHTRIFTTKNIIGAILVLGLLLIISLTVILSKGKIDTFISPSENISSILADKEAVWLADWFRQEIYKCEVVKGDMVVRRTYRLSSVPMGLVIAKGYLWTLDSWSKRINRHIFDDELTITAKFGVPGSNPSAICMDGSNLWTTDSVTHKIYKHAIDSELSVIATFDNPAARAIGFFFDGKYYWTIDGDKDMIYKHRNDIKLSIVRNYKMDLASKKISGIFIDRKYVWLAFEGEKQIIRYPREKFLKSLSQ